MLEIFIFPSDKLEIFITGRKFSNVFGLLIRQNDKKDLCIFLTNRKV